MSSDRQAPGQYHPMRGPIIFAVSAGMFGLMAFVVKIASAGVGGAQIAVIRFAVGVLPFLLIPSVRRQSLEWQRFDLLVYRGFFGGLAVLCYFSAIPHVPVGIATLLNYTTPLFSGVYAAIFAGERIRARVVVPLAVAFFGVVLVVRGNAAMSDSPFGGWELLALASAVFAGAAVTAIRMARRTESSWSIFTSFCIFGLVATLPFGLWNWTWPTAFEWVLLVLVGLLGLVGQILMTHAFRWVPTLTAGVISQVAVPVSMALGIFFLGERLTLTMLAGAALTLAGIVSVMLVSARGYVKEQ